MNDDAQTIALCLSGFPERFRELVERHGPDIRAFVGARADRGATDDVTVEAFTRAWLKLASLRDPGAFGSWVKGIALRVLRERARVSPTSTRASVPVLPSPQMPQPSTPGVDPDLLSAIESLPEAYGAVIRLRYFAGISCREIAHSREVPVGTVTKQLARAYVLLRAALEQHNPRAPHIHSKATYELPERT